ncbi:MAG: glycosyltransferase family 4 protein [Patescibacteria group bacterium]|nr:glycosyltransferase family 4 protein [Patescibacteria group bacterium]MDI6821532.1 glycosyltransferase family 4 protein [Actinomycetota bacterium]
MKVYVVSSYPTEGCGVSKYTKQLIDGLKGNDVEVILGRIFFYREKKHLLAWFGFLYEVLRKRPDIVHVQYTPTICGPLFPLFLICLKPFRVKAKLVLTAHEKSSIYEKHLNIFTKLLFHLYETIIYRLTNKILVHTREHKNELLVKFKIDAEKVETIPHGVDQAKEVTLLEKQKIRERYNLGNSVLITFLGAIRPNKGLEYLIAAFPKVLERRKGLVLVIAGGASPSHANYLGKLKSMVNDLELEGKVFFTGFVKDLDIPAIVSASKLMVLPYVHITQSGVLYREAITYEKPIIATDVGGMAKVVQEYRIGLTVPPKNSEVLAGAILDLLNDEKKLELFCRNERLLKEELSWDNIAKLHHDTYGRLVT